MTDAIEPPAWLEGWKPATAAPKPKAAGNPNWHPKMRSPNPAGRPRGIVDKRVKIAQQMLDDAQGIVGVMIEKAMEGDSAAAALVLSRVLPALRSQSEKVQFEFDASAPVVRQVEQVLEAIAAGAVAPDIGKQIIEAIGTLANVRAAEELETRITLLEAKAI